MLRQPISLLALPNELLLTIVDELHTPDLLNLALTCRRLLMPARVKLYEWVLCETDEACRKLAAALSDNDGLRNLVKGMNLQPLKEVVGNVAYDEDGEPFLVDSDDEDMIEDVLAPDEGQADWLALQTFLPAVRQVTLSGVSASVASRFLEEAGKTMPGLFHVVLPNELENFDDNAISDLRRSISSIPAVGGLRLVSSYSGHWCLLRLEGDANIPLANVASLLLGADIPEVEHMADLASVFPNLQRLELFLHDESTKPAYEHLITTAPTGLATLGFVGRSAEPIDHLLHRFPNLLELRLASNTFSPRALLPYLSASNLVRLEFRSDAPVDDRFLSSLVDEKHRPKCLRHLALNYLDLKWPSTALRYVLPHRVKQRPVPDFQAFKDEARPKWPTGCSEAGLLRVLEAARTSSLHVYGTAVDALDWDRDFEEELERALVNYAHPRPAHDFMEEILGRDGASEALRRRRPDLVRFICSGEVARESE